MSDLQNQDHLLQGALLDLIDVTLEIGDRKEQAATKGRTVEDVAVDPHRLELSADYKRSLAFLEGTKKRARELTQEIQKHIAEYDSMGD